MAAPWQLASLLAVLAALALQGAAAAQAPATEAALLLSASKSFTNFEAALADPVCQAPPGQPWSTSTLPCGDGQPGSNWRGVVCTPDGHVTELSLPFCGLEGSLPAELAKLEALTKLDLQHNDLYGGVPPGWTAIGAFPQLQTLQLAFNQLEGGLDDFTPTTQGFLGQVAYFNVSRNRLDQSTIPAEWYSRQLALLDISYNEIASTLPVVWGDPVPLHEGAYPSAFPSLARLAIEGNNITGPADPWPGGGNTVFSPNFKCTGKPGNPDMLLIPPPPARGASANSANSGSSSLSAGAIAGIVVGSVAAAALLAGAAALLVARRRKQRGTADGAGAKGSGGSLAPSSDIEKGGPGSNKDSASASYDARGSGGSGSLPSAAARSSDVGAADTDTAKLPAEWNVIPFADLELASTLGRGSFGAVSAARWCKTTVAVKVLGGSQAPAASDDAYARHITEQLKKEAGIMASLRHPNIVLQLGVCEQPPALVMEYASRRSVDELITSARSDPRAAAHLRWPRLLALALDAAKGMLYLHTRSPPVYHRDLKSANLLVTATWQCKVADFNMSQILEPGRVLSTLCIQNPRWLAPEVLGGAPGGLSADVWAFGTVLWELMSWQCPFEDTNAFTIINTVQSAERGSGLAVPPPDALPAGPLGQYRAYVALVEACWERDPAKRPAFEEITERLRAILAAEVGRRGSGSAAPSPMLSVQPPSSQASGPLSGLPSGALSGLPSGALPVPGSGLQPSTASATTASEGPAFSPTAAAAAAATHSGGSGGEPAASPFAAAPPFAASPFAAGPGAQ